ncbi:MAG: CsbD family protein [Thermostichus sp. BF3_bins_97]
MSLEKRVEATAKNLEGKIQEAGGELTGDQREKLEGKAKQAEAAARHVVEDIREPIKDVVDDVMD